MTGVGTTDVGENWAGNLRFRASGLRTPASVDELSALIRSEPTLRAVGTRHSFDDVADTSGLLVSTSGLGGEVELDEAERRVWVPGSARYGEVARFLHERGWALHNLASLPHISVAGTIATGTHGSGARHGSLATAVCALELVDGTGRLIRLDRGDADFDGAVVALGALGIVVRVALDIEPDYEVNQRVYLDLDLETVVDQLPRILALGTSTSLFTRWRGRTVDQLWVKSRGEEAPAETFGGIDAPGKMHPIAGVDPTHCTEQLGVPGPWHERLPHFRLEFTPSAGEELQSEYFVAAEDGPAAIRAVSGLAERLAPVLLVTEIRAVAADPLWLSGAHGRDTVALHFTWRRDTEAVLPVVREVERVLAPFGARPHWGKVSTLERDELAPLYPRWDDFLALRARLDPDGRFVNAHTRRTLLGG